MVTKAVKLFKKTTLLRPTPTANKHQVTLPSGIEINFRPPSAGESEAFVDCVEQSFEISYNIEQRDRFIAGLDRSLALVGVVEEKLVATLAGHYLTETLAGSRQIRALALTDIGVVSAARGQGIFRGILDRCLNDASDRGDLLCVLSTEQPALYRRHGFGRATSGYSYSVSGTLRRPLPATGVVVFLSTSEALSAIPEVFAGIGAQRPGELERPLPLIEELLAAGTRSSERRVIAVVLDDLVMGYAVFERRKGDTDLGAKLWVLEVGALSIDVSRRLWCALIELGDGAVECVDLPGDEPLRECFAPACSISQAHQHGRTFNRLVDLPSALSSRTYLCAASLNIVVDDATLPANSGTWKITTSASGDANVRRTNEAPDLGLSMAMLATLFSGEGNVSELETDQETVVYRDGAQHEAVELFGIDSCPYSTSLC